MLKRALKGSPHKELWTLTPISLSDEDCSNGRCYEYIVANAKHLWNGIRYGAWFSLTEERFARYSWSWAIDSLKEVLYCAYLIYIRKVKIGVDCNMSGRYGYDLKDGRPLFEVITKGGGYY